MAEIVVDVCFGRTDRPQATARVGSISHKSCHGHVLGEAGGYYHALGSCWFSNTHTGTSWTRDRFRGSMVGWFQVGRLTGFLGEASPGWHTGDTNLVDFDPLPGVFPCDQIHQWILPAWYPHEPRSKASPYYAELGKASALINASGYQRVGSPSHIASLDPLDPPFIPAAHRFVQLMGHQTRIVTNHPQPSFTIIPDRPNNHLPSE